MPLGYALLILALVATVAANFLFTVARHGDRSGLLTWAKRMVGLSTAGVLGASVYLMYLIATHQFQVSYVAEYSAKRSSAWYLFAAFWGGQEGSILLWAFWTAILGAVLAWRGGERVAKIWPIFGIVPVYLLGLLLLKCPFALSKGPIPLDGKGLNPLLENYWMVIHPPILFLGFASTAIPSAWAIYGLIHRDWDGWARSAFSWTLFSFATLGFGLSLGGFWAYETLGWGGFWAWDPVENSSLVPWLFLTALLHGIPLQLKNGGGKITTLLLGILPFATMNYGTFLTRTGLLSDFSVHSFSSLGKDGYAVMLGGVIVSTFVPLALLLARLFRREIPKAAAYEKVVTREFGYFLAAAILGVLGVLVAVGMSAPILTKLWLAKGAAAQPEFYNQAAYPLAILMTFLMAITPYLAWKTNALESIGKRLFPAYIAAIGMTLVLTAAGWYLGVRKPWMVLLFATSLFTMTANLLLILPRLKHASSRKTLGGFTAHIGASMTLAGVAALVAFSKTQEGVPLVKDQPTPVLGYTLTYLGYVTHPFDREGNAIRIRVEKDGRAWESRPRYYFAPWNNKDELFGNPPAIHRRFWGDLYIAHAGDAKEILDDPGAVSSNNLFSMKEGQSRTFGDYTFGLLSLGLDDKAKAALQQHKPEAMNALPQVVMTATVAVTYQGKETIVQPAIRQEKAGGIYSQPAAIPGPEGAAPVILRFVPPPPESEVMRVQAEAQKAIEAAKKIAAPGTEAFRKALMEGDGAAAIMQSRQIQEMASFQTLTFETFGAPDPNDAVFVSVSAKPMIWFVWLGTLLYSLGGLIAYRRRAIEQGILGVQPER